MKKRATKATVPPSDVWAAIERLQALAALYEADDGGIGVSDSLAPAMEQLTTAISEVERAFDEAAARQYLVDAIVNAYPGVVDVYRSVSSDALGRDACRARIGTTLGTMDRESFEAHPLPRQFWDRLVLSGAEITELNGPSEAAYAKLGSILGFSKDWMRKLCEKRRESLGLPSQLRPRSNASIPQVDSRL